jgi:FHS family L-fucose permease-like MFS transporter
MAFAARTVRSTHDLDVPLIPRQNLTSFLLVTGLFFLWAIPNNLNDVLIRQFMKSFELSRLQAGLVQSSFYSGYFLFSMPAAILMRRHGYKFGLLTGLLLYSAGTFLFLPAALMRSYSFFLLALFVLASGLGFLETGANPLIAQMGDPDSSVQRLNIAQAFNPLGAICGVLVGTFFIFSGVELSAVDIQRMRAIGTYDAYLQHETMRVIAPYLCLGVVVLLWALMIARNRFPVIAEEQSCIDITPRGGYRQLLSYPHFLLAVFTLFSYEGAQVGTWSYFIQYVQDYSHQPEKVAGQLLTGTLVGFALGRFVASALMKRISAGRLMGIFSLINIILVAVGILFPGWLGIGAIFITSFFMSLMFPTIFALGLNGLGKSTKSGSSILVMAIIGGAIFTPLIGLISQRAHSMAAAMIVPLLCYIVVAFYGFWGCHLKPRFCTE